MDYIKPVEGMKVEYGSSLNAIVWKVLDNKVLIRWSKNSKNYNEITLKEWQDYVKSEFIIIK